MIWFTSDLHLCHDKEFIWKDRGFSSIDEMNEEIVKRFNSVVKPEDTVYILGDLMLNCSERGIEFIKKLNGQLHVIYGNHDTESRIEMYSKCENIIDGKFADILKFKKHRFFLSHYPCITSNIDDDIRPHTKIINLYGHTHQKTNFYNGNSFMYHVGLDSHDCYPVNIEKILADIKEVINGK